MYKLVNFLNWLKENNYTVTELGHAYRINGCYDIWKSGKKVYYKNKNIYRDTNGLKRQIEITKEVLPTLVRVDDYKRAKNGISYKEFKNNLRNIEVKTFSEDYHWKQNIEKTSEEHLYFVVCNNRIKIRRSKNVEKRMMALSTGLSDDYTCYKFDNKGFLEPLLHRAFSDINTIREWFVFDVRIKRFIDTYHKGNVYNHESIIREMKRISDEKKQAKLLEKQSQNK